MKKNNRTKISQIITMIVYGALIMVLTAVVFADGDSEFDTGEGGGYKPTTTSHSNTTSHISTSYTPSPTQYSGKNRDSCFYMGSGVAGDSYNANATGTRYVLEYWTADGQLKEVGGNNSSRYYLNDINNNFYFGSWYDDTHSQKEVYKSKYSNGAGRTKYTDYGYNLLKPYEKRFLDVVIPETGFYKYFEGTIVCPNPIPTYENGSDNMINYQQDYWYTPVTSDYFSGEVYIPELKYWFTDWYNKTPTMNVEGDENANWAMQRSKIICIANLLRHLAEVRGDSATVSEITDILTPEKHIQVSLKAEILFVNYASFDYENYEIKYDGESYDNTYNLFFVYSTPGDFYLTYSERNKIIEYCDPLNNNWTAYDEHREGGTASFLTSNYVDSSHLGYDLIATKLYEKDETYSYYNNQSQCSCTSFYGNMCSVHSTAGGEENQFKQYGYEDSTENRTWLAQHVNHSEFAKAHKMVDSDGNVILYSRTPVIYEGWDFVWNRETLDYNPTKVTTPDDLKYNGSFQNLVTIENNASYQCGMVYFSTEPITSENFDFVPKTTEIPKSKNVVDCSNLPQTYYWYCVGGNGYESKSGVVNRATIVPAPIYIDINRMYTMEYGASIPEVTNWSQVNYGISGESVIASRFN